MPLYITYDDYEQRVPEELREISEAEFDTWARKVSQYIDVATMGRLTSSETYNQYKDCVTDAAFELLLHIKNIETDGDLVKIRKSERTGSYSESFVVPKTYLSYDSMGAALSILDYCGGKATGLRYRGIDCEKTCCFNKSCRW